MNALPLTLKTVLAASLLFALAPHGPAVAQEPVRQVVPYSGHLDNDGRPFDGSAALRFRVYDQPADGGVLWTEIHPAVNVRDGRFAVRLGEQPVADGQASIVELATRGDQLYLELSVAMPAAEGVEPVWTQLAGRQAIHPVPQALWLAPGNNLETRRVTAFEVDVTGRMFNSGAGPVAVNDSFFVNGDTRVAGNLRVDGRITTPTLRATPVIELNARNGSERENGPSADNHICVLGRVLTDADGTADCYVVEDGGRWQLRADNAFCRMYCYQFAD